VLVCLNFVPATASDHPDIAHAIACDYANLKYRHWVPILAILCDGEKFEFFVYDSGIKSVYSSGMVTGVADYKGDPDLLVSSLKKSRVANILPYSQFSALD
jgi:hypothetical protein